MFLFPSSFSGVEGNQSFQVSWVTGYQDHIFITLFEGGGEGRKAIGKGLSKVQSNSVSKGGRERRIAIGKGSSKVQSNSVSKTQK
jgi:hypothetical protein